MNTNTAPQGVAGVMRLAQDYADCDTSGLDNTRRALRHEKIEHAITAIVKERDALKADNRLLHSGQLDLVNRIYELESLYLPAVAKEPHHG